MESHLDPTFQEATDSKKVPGVAAIALDATGKVLFSKGYGNAVVGDPKSSDATTESLAMMFSCTKLFTSIAALQLIERGQLNLDDYAEKYVPELGQLQILEGFNEDGSLKLRPAQNKIKMLHLFTHTAGFTYDFIDPLIVQYRKFVDQPTLLYENKAQFTHPLIFEPGARYEYGISTDWLGIIVEAISGQRVDAYIDANIVQPLGLKNTVQCMTAEQEKNSFVLHVKDAAGTLTPFPHKQPEAPETVAGGQYLYSTCEDYAQLLLTVLNKGTHPTSGVSILAREIVDDYLFTDMIPKVGCTNDGIGVLPKADAAIFRRGEFLPGVSKGWSLGFMINHEDVPNGRRKGSGAWSGMGNCYYWVDPTAGKLGMVVTSVMPYFDPDVLHLADALERAVYGRPAATSAGEEGSNFRGGEYGLPR